ncbi:hypothetical protein OKW46_004436 [Paraburkholderia sp. WSM4179]|nr:hypothetical protein [Paraburkholderia sp. WSM4179]
MMKTPKERQTYARTCEKTMRQQRQCANRHIKPLWDKAFGVGASLAHCWRFYNVR